MLVVWSLGVVVRGDSAYPDNQRFEPTVDRQEAEWLATAQSMAETNTSAAIDFLTGKTDPEANAALDFALGNFYYQSEKLDLAARSYRDAVDKLPLFKKAISNLGRIYLIQEKPEKTLELYRKLVENGLASADIYSLLGQAHLLLDNYVSAENAFRQVLLLQPKSGNARLGLAKCLLQQERYAESRALATEILEEDANDKEVWALRANLALALDKPEDAMLAIESARRLDAASAEMLATLGDIYLNRQQPQEAVEAYRSAFAGSTPSFKRLVNIADVLLAIGAVDEASEMLVKAEATRSAENCQEQQLALLRLRADIARKEGDTAKALRLLRQGLELDPLNGELLMELARIDWERGNLEEAILKCERAARIDGYQARALVLQGQIEVERENYTRALQLLERAQTFQHQKHVQDYLEQVRALANRN